MIKSEVITLKPISKEDTDFILALRNDLEIADQFFSDPPVYDVEHESWLQVRNKTDLDFIVVLNETGERAGRIYINNVDYRNRKGEYGIVIHPDYRGRTLAFLSSELLLRYVFLNLPIKKIILKVFSDNNKAINLYKKIGFIQEGYLKEDVYKNGSFKDVCMMAVFKDQWIENKISKSQ